MASPFIMLVGTVPCFQPFLFRSSNRDYTLSIVHPTLGASVTVVIIQTEVHKIIKTFECSEYLFSAISRLIQFIW